MFSGKKIIVGVAGGIAAYKSAELIRALKKAAAEVRVIMTEAAAKFVTPLTFETLSENSVLTSLFPAEGGTATVHIDWARWPDAFIICPATLNVIGKIASGIADDALTTTLMATTAPVIFCPAMNKEMYANKMYQANQQCLIDAGYNFVAPGSGELACGEEGWGRLANQDEIIDNLKKVLYGNSQLAGKTVLVTAGPTIEPIDPVRYISNYSSGKMGFAIAEKAKLRGANVYLISGPTQLIPFNGIHYVKVRTANEMKEQVCTFLPQTDIFIAAAAVSDYRPSKPESNKIKKNADHLSIELVANDDILLLAGNEKGKRIHVGFSVETTDEIKSSQAKLEKKKLDFIVINNPLEEGAGFETDTNKVIIMDRNGRFQNYPLMPKPDVADLILDQIAALLK